MGFQALKNDISWLNCGGKGSGNWYWINLRQMADRTMSPSSVCVSLLNLTWDKTNKKVRFWSMCLTPPPPYPIAPSSPHCEFNHGSILFFFLLFFFFFLEPLHEHESVTSKIKFQKLNREIRGFCHPSKTPWVTVGAHRKSNRFPPSKGLEAPRRSMDKRFELPIRADRRLSTSL